MSFNHEPEPVRGIFLPIAPGVSRAVANNPSIMTYHGTNTYLIETADGNLLLDPGPAHDQDHYELIRSTMRENGAGIIVSHFHSDHFGLAERLRSDTGLPVYASAYFAGDAFVPDVALSDGDLVGGLQVLHTPGHASDHLCLARPDGIVFTADHVMSWSSSIVRLPDGDMAAYIKQLGRLIARGDGLYLPGHGPALADPVPYVQGLLDNRIRRERKILTMVTSQSATASHISATLYAKSDARLAWAAERNVEAHLAKLEAEGYVHMADGQWIATERGFDPHFPSEPDDEADKGNFDEG